MERILEWVAFAPGRTPPVTPCRSRWPPRPPRGCSRPGPTASRPSSNRLEQSKEGDALFTSPADVGRGQPLTDASPRSTPAPKSVGRGGTAWSGGLAPHRAVGLPGGDPSPGRRPGCAAAVRRTAPRAARRAASARSRAAPASRPPPVPCTGRGGERGHIKPEPTGPGWAGLSCARSSRSRSQRVTASHHRRRRLAYRTPCAVFVPHRTPVREDQAPACGPARGREEEVLRDEQRHQVPDRAELAPAQGGNDRDQTSSRLPPRTSARPRKRGPGKRSRMCWERVRT